MKVLRHCYDCDSTFYADLRPGVKLEQIRHVGCQARMIPWWVFPVIAAVLLCLGAFLNAESQERCPTLAEIPPPGSCSFNAAGEPSCAPGEISPEFIGLTDAQLRPLLCGHSTQGARCKLDKRRRKALWLAYSLEWRPKTKQHAEGPSPGAFEVDHYIEESLGGAQSISNLYPEAAEPRPGYHEKDLVEAKLHRDWCAGLIGIQEARAILLRDWRGEYRRMMGEKWVHMAIGDGK